MLNILGASETISLTNQNISVLPPKLLHGPQRHREAGRFIQRCPKALPRTTNGWFNRDFRSNLTRNRTTAAAEKFPNTPQNKSPLPSWSPNLKHALTSPHVLKKRYASLQVSLCLIFYLKIISMWRYRGLAYRKNSSAKNPQKRSTNSPLMHTQLHQYIDSYMWCSLCPTPARCPTVDVFLSISMVPGQGTP